MDSIVQHRAQPVNRSRFASPDIRRNTLGHQPNGTVVEALNAILYDFGPFALDCGACALKRADERLAGRLKTSSTAPSASARHNSGASWEPVAFVDFFAIDNAKILIIQCAVNFLVQWSLQGKKSTPRRFLEVLSAKRDKPLAARCTFPFGIVKSGKI